MFDLVIQGKDLSLSSLPEAVVRLGSTAEETAPGAVRIRDAVSGAGEQARALLCRCSTDIAEVPRMRLSDFRVFASDMDSTLLAGESLDDSARKNGLGEAVAEITKKAMEGSIPDYAESLRERMKLFRGLPETVLASIGSGYPLNPGAERLIRAVQKAGISFYIVTSGFIQSAEAASVRLGTDGFLCNTAESRNGILTGEISGPEENAFRIMDSEGKKTALQALCSRHGVPVSASIAIGDGWNDVKMIQSAGVGIAFHAKPRVRALAPYRIDSLGLDSLLNWFEDGPGILADL